MVSDSEGVSEGDSEGVSEGVTAVSLPAGGAGPDAGQRVGRGAGGRGGLLPLLRLRAARVQPLEPVRHHRPPAGQEDGRSALTPGETPVHLYTHHL